VTIYRKMPTVGLSPSVKESEKMVLNPHPAPDQHQKLITSRGLITPCQRLPCLVDVR